MKKTNSNFKILTNQEKNQVKGGGWISSFFQSMYDRYQTDKAAEAAMASMETGGCPPPEPDDE